MSLRSDSADISHSPIVLAIVDVTFDTTTLAGPSSPLPTGGHGRVTVLVADAGQHFLVARRLVRNTPDLGVMIGLQRQDIVVTKIAQDDKL